MKKSKFTENEIFGMFKQQENRLIKAEICRHNGISQATLYVWKKKYGAMQLSDIKKVM